MNTDFYLRCPHCFCLLGLLLTEFIAIRRRITLILVNCHCLWLPFCGPTFLRVILTLRLQARAKTGQNSRPFFSSSTLGHFLWNWKWNDVIREFCPLLYFVKCIFNRFGNLYGINPTDLSVGRWRRKNVKAISFWSTTTPGRPRAPFVADDHIASFLLSTTSTEHSSDLLKLVKSVRFSSSWKCDTRDGTLLFPSSLEDEIIQLKFYEQNVLKCSARLRHRNKDLEST